jgi:hypothetical protein
MSNKKSYRGRPGFNLFERARERKMMTGKIQLTACRYPNKINCLEKNRKRDSVPSKRNKFVMAL